MLKKDDVISLVKMALDEDIGAGDITTGAIFNGTEPGKAIVIAREEGVFCSGNLPTYVYGELDSSVRVAYNVEEGASVAPGTAVLSLEGPAASLLTGERTALNFLQRMCGIATAASRAVKALEETGIVLLDTRKTAPGMRALDKYAVKTGGGENHRFGLHDMVMIKDNHIKAAGGIREAVEKVRLAYGNRYLVEVEATSDEEVGEALDAKADIIMLDNMDYSAMVRCIGMIGGRAKTEVSGNVTQDTLKGLAGLEATYVSMGSLTHSVRAFDLSMKFL